MGLEQASYRDVASSEAVTFDQSLVDRRDLYPLVGPRADLVGKRLCQGLRWLLAPWELKQGFQDIVGREWSAEVQPALRQRQRAKLSGFRSSHCACASNIPVRLAQPHPGNNVTNFVHCEPPVGHPFLLVFQEVRLGGEEVRAKCFYGALKIGVAPLRVPMNWHLYGCRRFSSIGVPINTKEEAVVVDSTV